MVARIDLPADQTAALIERYRAGTAVQALAAEAGVSRQVVNRWLIEAGLDVRNRGAAMTVRMAATPADERARLTAAANQATRGRSASERERSERAITVAPHETWIGMGEDETAALLSAQGLAVRRQVPVGPYNLDLAVGHVAIEVHRKTTYPLRLACLRERAAYLREQGWAVIYLWCARGARRPGVVCISEAAASVVATKLDAVPGAFHVVRCTGVIATRAA